VVVVECIKDGPVPVYEFLLAFPGLSEHDEVRRGRDFIEGIAGAPVCCDEFFSSLPTQDVWCGYGRSGKWFDECSELFFCEREDEHVAQRRVEVGVELPVYSDDFCRVHTRARHPSLFKYFAELLLLRGGLRRGFLFFVQGCARSARSLQSQVNHLSAAHFLR